MDIYCKKCREPWDIDTLHDVASEQGRTFDQVRSAFYDTGCEALDCRHGNLGYDPRIEALQELCGDDIDGLASDMEYFGIGGW